VVAGHLDHERTDEGRLALVDRIRDDRFGLLLHPRAGLGQRHRHLQGRPAIGAMDQLADAVLQAAVAHALGLADQQGEFQRQRCAAVDGAHEGVDHVVLVHHGLTGGGIAGIQMTLQIAPVDAGDLVRECGYRAVVVVQASQMQQDIGNVAVAASDHFLGGSLGFGIGPLRPQRPRFVDALAGRDRRVHQHRARVDKLSDLEVLQRLQQALRAFDVDLFVQRIRLAGEVEVGGQVHHRRDPVAVALAEAMHGIGDRVVLGQVDFEEGKVGLGCVDIEADDPVVAGQRLGERRADIAGDAGHEDDGGVFRSGGHGIVEELPQTVGRVPCAMARPGHDAAPARSAGKSGRAKCCAVRRRVDPGITRPRLGSWRPGSGPMGVCRA
jgi:hypothetical protein